MKIISWNVNGLKSCINKGMFDFFSEVDADVFCMQETKTNNDTDQITFSNYYKYSNYAQRKGYSGTTVFSKKKAFHHTNGFTEGIETEGRIITLQYKDFYLINCYSPHSRRDLSRIDYKQKFTNDLTQHVQMLMSEKPVIVCGDLNVAHREIDLKNYKSNNGNAGFTEIERTDFSRLLSLGLLDSYRHIYPNQEGAYTWWSYRQGVRQRNIGWRIDYILISESLKNKLKKCMIFHEVLGSDHCPVGIEIDI